jgi:integrase/recombinase XerD
LEWQRVFEVSTWPVKVVCQSAQPHTRKAYTEDLREFQRFVGIARPEEFRTVTCAHVIAWRKELARRGGAPTTIQQKLAAVSSLFASLAEHNAVLHNPVDGVKRPKSPRQEGTMPALSDEQARALLNAPQGESLKAKRDRAILARLAYHGMRREELGKLHDCSPYGQPPGGPKKSRLVGLDHQLEGQHPIAAR